MSSPNHRPPQLPFPPQQLCHAAASGDDKRVRSLLEAAPRGAAAALANARDATGLCALHRCAVGGSQKTAEALLSSGANVNERDSVSGTARPPARRPASPPGRPPARPYANPPIRVPGRPRPSPEGGNVHRRWA